LPKPSSASSQTPHPKVVLFRNVQLAILPPMNQERHVLNEYTGETYVED